MRRKIQLLLEENGYSYEDYAFPGSTLPFDSGIKTKRYIRLVKYYNSSLFTDKNEGFVDDIIRSVCAYAHAEGYETVISTVSQTMYPELLHSLQDDKSAGLLVIATEMTAAEINMLGVLTVPTVIIDTEFPDVSFSCVTMDNRNIAYKAVSHLLSLNCKSIGYLRSSVRTGNLAERGKGCQEALRSYNLNLPDSYVFDLTPSLKSAQEDMLRLISEGCKLPQGFFADNDVIAIGAIRALNQIGMSVPDDLYVIGVDNTLLAQIFVPSLTSFQISKNLMGQKAMGLLLEQIENPSVETVRVYINAQLIPRESTMRR